MAKTELEWAFDQGPFEFREVEVGHKPSRKFYEWRRREIARMIVDEGLTVRQVAEIFGIHNSNVYRAIGGSIGGIYSDVQDSWKQNKKRSQYKKKESTNK